MGFLLAKLHAAGSVLNNAALAEFGLKERSYSVLALACGDLGPTQRELADFLSLDPSQIVALIDELEQRGLVERKPGVSDRRQKLVAATAEGQKVHAAARKAAKAAEARHLSMLTAREVASLRSILGKAVWLGTPGIGALEDVEAVEPMTAAAGRVTPWPRRPCFLSAPLGGRHPGNGARCGHDRRGEHGGVVVLARVRVSPDSRPPNMGTGASTAWT